MKLHYVQMRGHVFWAMHPSDPLVFYLACIPGWSLVNPFVYGPLCRQLELPSKGFLKPTFVDGDRYHVATDGFWVAVEDDCDTPAWDKRDLYIGELLGRLSQWMRYASKQFDLIPRVSSYNLVGHKADRLPDPSFPDTGETAATDRWPLSTSLTGDDLEVVSHCNLAELPPSYDTMLLGAIQALMSANYGWAIVLSGVAIEHLARARLRREAHGHPGVLEDHAIRNAKLKDLLHKLRLSLSLSSLHCENPALYEAALGVYNQRNDILHGNIANDDHDWNTVRSSARAVQCAINVVQWFGERGGYENPFVGETAMVHSALVSDELGCC
ncbi:MAG: hypothetical protein ACYC5M_18860 [Anaerolineae bacterium]